MEFLVELFVLFLIEEESLFVILHLNLNLVSSSTI